jgi:hypothetical protein
MAHPTGRPLVCALDDVVYAVAWADLAPSFQRAAGDMAVLRQMTQDFREPVIWILLAIVARGIAEIVAFVLLDQDLIKHDQAEAGVEDELSVIYGRLGQQLPSPRSGPGEGAGQLCRPDPGRDLLTRDLHVLMVSTTRWTSRTSTASDHSSPQQHRSGLFCAPFGRARGASPAVNNRSG